MTPAQQRTYDAFQKCSDGGLTVQIEYVRQDGSYRYRAIGEPHRTALFRQCLTRERLEGWKDQTDFKLDPKLGVLVAPEPKVLLRHAYFTKTRPVGTVTGTTMPPEVSRFQIGDEVVLFLGVDKSGRVLHGKFRWLRPDGGLAVEQARRLTEGPGEGTWTWFAQILAPAHLRVAGTWAVETYFDDQLVGRYEFLVVKP
jgi:hypothetical protein